MQDLINELNENRKLLNQLISSKKNVGRKLAKAEFNYKKARSKAIAELNILGYDAECGHMKPLPATACEGMSHGIDPVAELRLKRDLKKYDYDAIQEKIYQTKIEISIIQGQIDAILNKKI